MCFKCCCGFFPTSSLKTKVVRGGSVKVSTPVIEFHPISEQEQLFAKKLRWIPPLEYNINNNNEDSSNTNLIKSTSLESTSPPQQKKVDAKVDSASSR